MRIYKALSIFSICILIFAGIYLLFNIRKPKLINEWKVEGVKKGEVKDIEVDSEGNIYLAVKNRIKVFSRDGEFMKEIGKEGNLMSYAMESNTSFRKVGGEGEEEFIALKDILFYDGYIYASDSLLNMIKKFRKDGRFEKNWGGVGRERGKFYDRLKGIAGIDSKGNVYAYDSGRIQKFDSEGNYLQSARIEKLEEGGFILKVDREGKFYIFSILERKIYIYKGESLSESIILEKIDPDTSLILDMNIGKSGVIYLLSKERRIIRIIEGGEIKKIKLKEEKEPILFGIDGKEEYIYLLSFEQAPFSSEEESDVYIEIYKL
jgi:hypothetical protein